MASASSGGLRVLIDPRLDGPSNMARDEVLLLGNESGDSPPTLRVYRWDEPTISLGYFQPYSAFQDLSETLRSLAVVRRLTGGGAILHDRELTYSLSLPCGHRLLEGGPSALYETAHAAVAQCLAELAIRALPAGSGDDSGPRKGPFFCFARRHRFDLLVGDAKIAGSAQRRTRKALLQHGSIILGSHFPEQPAPVVSISFEKGIERLTESLPLRLAEALGLSAEPGGWTPEELARSEELVMKYAGQEWTRRA